MAPWNGPNNRSMFWSDVHPVALQDQSTKENRVKTINKKLNQIDSVILCHLQAGMAKSVSGPVVMNSN